jgi:hypothetical protein
MMRHSLSISVFFLCLKGQLKLSSSSSLSGNSNGDSNSNSNSNSDGDGDLCGMYLAPSTIPGAGMGVFAGHNDIPKGNYLLTDDGDLVVPAYEMTKHIGHTKYSFLWEEYTWKAASFHGMNEEVDDVKKVKACSTGIGAAINCILPMVNVVDDYDARQVGLSGISVVDSDGNNSNTTTMPLLTPSLSSPGVGAFTPYHNRRWKARRDIPAGMELYGNYGSGYFTSRSSYNNVPLLKNYRQIDKLLKQFQSITNDSNLITREQKNDVLAYLQSLSTIWDDSRNMHAIPQTDPPGDAGVVDWLLQQTGGSGMIHYNASIRDSDWLHEHGRCMDNIRDGISRIPHAGRGAFARRALAKGTIVAPAPLIQIPDRSVFTIYDKKRTTSNSNDGGDDGGEAMYELVADHDKPVHHQLLLNYCFGHGESSLLLCPYGLMTSHINHDATNPNTKVIWATDDQMAHPEWRKKPIEKWGIEEKAGLSFNFVALRNIEQDEEITINYGSEWEEAWLKHLRSYYQNDEGNEKAVHNNRIARSSRDTIDKHRVPAFELNKLLDMKLQTMEEGDYESEGLRLFCRKPYLEWSSTATSVVNKNDGTTLLVRSTTKTNKTIKLKRKKYTDWSNNEVYPCRIRNRYRPTRTTGDASETNDNHDYRYFIEVFERSDEILPLEVAHNTNNTTKDYVWAVLFDAPRDAFYFEDQKNHRHHHQAWSFRHEMRIPDDMFPYVWRNNRKEGTVPQSV